LAVFFVVYVGTLVLTPVFPGEGALAVHLVVSPLPCIAAGFIWPGQDAPAVHTVVGEVTDILLPTGEEVNPFARLYSICVVPLVPRPV
jgi:hypothetical protein